MDRYEVLMVMMISLCLSVLAWLPSATAHKEFEFRSMICLKEFPTDPVLFTDDMKPYVSRIIAKHGIEEWKAVVLTNEMHHHMGLWPIIGAKMGIRARELLNAPLDGLNVVSYSGVNPPYICLNDGLQVATGASLGRGTIKVSDGKQPVAHFICQGKEMTLKVKPEITGDIEQVINECSQRYVFQSPRYFRELDKISIEYWLKWDRRHLFDELVAP
jgi:pyrimidine-specific ribonucleoside hydrolase